MPKLLKTPFAIDAAEGFRTDIQENTGAAPNSATYQVGFPPVTMQSIASNGMPPKGSDLNGVLYDITDNLVFLTQGGGYGFDAAYATSIGGYPLNARLRLTNGDIVKNIDIANTNDPNTNMTGWVLEHSATAVILTLEMFGGKTFLEDPLFDNADVIDEMFRSIYSIYDIHTGLTSTQIRAAINDAKPTVIQLNGLYRTTRQFHIPPCVTINQCFEGYFTQNPKSGLFYDSTDLNTYAVAPFLYRRDTEVDDYYVDNDVMSLPTGFDFDNGVCIMAGVRQQLRNLFVITRRGTTLAFRLVGWAGCYAENIGCGENIGLQSRNPKVAGLIASAWGARIEGINTLSTHQGFIPFNANGGLVVNGMYSNQAAVITDYVPTNDLIEPIYKPTAHTQLGSTGIMQIGEAMINSPICEGWYLPYVAYDARVSLHEPHFERIDGYNFYLINCEADITLKGVTSIEAKALFYLKDYRDYGREVKVRGLLSMGGKLVEGENSDPSLILDVLRPHTFIQFFGFGDLSLIKSVENKWGVDSVYVDSVNGDDEYTGLRDIRALKTLSHAKKICDLFDVKTIVLLNDLTVSATVDMPNKFKFIGNHALTLNNALRIPDAGAVEIGFNNNLVNGSTGSALLFNTEYNHGSINIKSDINLPSSTLFQTIGDLDLDVNITNTTTNFSLISYCPNYGKVAIGWNVKSPTYNIPYRFDGGGGIFKFISRDVGAGSLAVTSQSIAATQELTLDIPVKEAQLSDNISATYSSYTAGLTFSGVVDVNGNVKASIRNNTGVAITLPSGTLSVKMV